MSELHSCISCNGLIPSAQEQCPHCSAYTPSRKNPVMRHLLRGASVLAGSSAFALTLMACYGAPPCEPEDDGDGDGYCLDDCDDTNADIYPGADDPLGDDIDQNCDTVDGIYEEETDGGSSEDGGASDDAGIDETDAGAADAG
jgi:hypothetical protein